MRMNKYAEDEGAKIIFGATFVDFVKDEWGKVCGAKYKTAEGEFEAEAKLVADCSGIPAVARTKMPDDSTVENYKLTPEDIFYVVIYYVKQLLHLSSICSARNLISLKSRVSERFAFSSPTQTGKKYWQG